MRRHTLGRRLALWGVVGSLLATAAVAETHEIGTVGATFESTDWERTQLTSSLGKDQFRRIGGESYLVFFEIFALFQERDDFTERLERFINAATPNLEDVVIDPNVEFGRSEGIGRAIRRFSGTASGVAVSYQVELHSAGDGVGFLLLSWVASAQSGPHGLHMEAVVDAFTLPGPETEWHEKTQPTEHHYDFDGWTVSLTFADSILRDSDSLPGQRYSLQGDEGELAIHLFLDHLEGDLEEVLAEIVEVAADGGDYEELYRSPLDLPLGPGEQVFIRLHGNPTTDIAIALFGIGDERWVDLRLATNDSIHQRRGLWEDLLDSLRVEEEEPVDAFPVPDPENEPENEPEDEPAIPPKARSLLEAGRFLTGLDWGDRIRRLDSGELLVQTDDRVTLRAPGSEALTKPNVLYQASDSLSGTFVRWGEQTLWIQSGQEVQAVREGQALPAGFIADRAVSAGTSLLIARSREGRSLPGIRALSAVGPTELWLRSTDGRERELVELPDQRVLSMASRADSALVATLARRHSATSWYVPLVTLHHLDFERGRLESLEPWYGVRRIEAAGDSWLVSGRNADGVEGVFRLAESGGPNLLVKGDFEGLSLDGDELDLLTRHCPDRSQPRCLYRVPLPAVEEFGAQATPFTADDLNRIAEVADVRLALSSEALTASMAAANRAAIDLVGESLPTTEASWDQLLIDLVYDRGLTAKTLDLLANGIASQLVASGAQFSPSTTATEASFGGSGWEATNPFVVGLHPASIVVSTLYDADGWYRPLTQIGEQTYGRLLFVGPDLRALERAVHEAYPEPFDALLNEGTAKQITAFLLERRENLSLRGHAYRHLVTLGRSSVLAEVPLPFATEGDVQGFDLVALLADPLSKPLKAEQAEELIPRLRNAIEEHPEVAGLYHQLGIVYEATERPDRRALALACYEKVLELTASDGLGDAAEEAINRLHEEIP